MIRTAALIFAFALALSPAAAQTPAKHLGEFRDWVAATMQVDGKVCMAYTQPTKSSPEDLKREPVVLYVTRQPGGDGKAEVTVKIGYTFRENSTPTLSVDGGDTFQMFTRGDNAWLENVEDDPRVIRLMRKGRALEVRATSSRGSRTTDTFSLLGMSAAIERAWRECD